MNNLRLKAIRHGLGLEVSEAAELVGVQKRAFNYWEQGLRSVPDDVVLTFGMMTVHYALVLEKMVNDVTRITTKNSIDETKPSRCSPTLPFYRSFDDFKTATGCEIKAYWRTYQSVISQLILLGHITKLDDNAIIPVDFGIWKWLSGAYEMS